MKNYHKCVYTVLHRRALYYVYEKFASKIPDNLHREIEGALRVHDCDKLYMYQFLKSDDASKIHRVSAAHHMEIENPLSKKEIDYIEAVLDYESAAYTKPDKPLNAYDTVNMLWHNNQLSKRNYDRLMSVIEALGINYSYSISDDEVELQNFKEKVLLEVTRRDILDVVGFWLDLENNKLLKRINLNIFNFYSQEKKE